MSTSVGSIHYDLGLNTKAFDSATKRTLGGIKSFAKTASITLAAVGAATVAFGVSSVKSYADAEAALAGLKAGLKNTGKGAIGFSKILQDQASVLQSTTRFSDEQIISAQAMLTTFQLQGNTIKKLTPSILDMAESMRDETGAAMSATDAAKMMGKVMGNAEGGIEGMSTALRRNGVIMTDAQKEIFATGTEEERLNTLTEILSYNFGGRAAAAGKTFAGKMTILKNTFDDFKEVVGKTIVKAITPFIDNMFNAIKKIGGVNGIFRLLQRTFIKVLLSIMPIITAVGDYLIPKFQALWNAIRDKVIPTLAKLWDAFAPFIGRAIVFAIGALADAFTWVADNIQILLPLVGGLVAGFVAFNVVAKVIVMIKAASVAFAIFNAVLFANPIGLVIGAVAALVVGIGLLITTLGINKKSTDDINRSRVTQAELALRAKDAELELKDALLTQEGALLRVEQAQLDYNEAVRTYGPKSLQARTAAYHLKVAQLELKTANDKARDATNKNKEAQERITNPGFVSRIVNSLGKVAGAFRGIANQASTASWQILQAASKADS
jgi:hypothetical protein